MNLFLRAWVRFFRSALSLGCLAHLFLVLPVCIEATNTAYAFEKEQSSVRNAYRVFALSPRWRPLTNSVPSIEVDASGLVGLNRGGQRYPELQTVGATFVSRGLATGNHEWVAQGWRILDAGMVGMETDGRLAGEPADLAHSSAFLLYWLADALMVDPAGATTERVARFLEAAGYLASPSRLREGQAMSHRFTHRAFMWSFVFAVANEFQPNPRWLDLSAAFLTMGLEQHGVEGYFIENGGFDALYQSIGLDFLSHLAVLQTNQAKRREIDWWLARGASVLVGRIDQSGYLDPTGSTRMTREKTRSGEPKQLSRWQLAQALLACSIVLDEPHFEKAARRAMSCGSDCQKRRSQ